MNLCRLDGLSALPQQPHVVADECCNFVSRSDLASGLSEPNEKLGGELCEPAGVLGNGLFGLAGVTGGKFCAVS